MVAEKDSVLHVINVNADKIVQMVTAAQLPSLPQQAGNVSIKTGIYYPLLTADNHLRLIHLDYYYYGNPKDPCK